MGREFYFYPSGNSSDVNIFTYSRGALLQIFASVEQDRGVNENLKQTNYWRFPSNNTGSQFKKLD